MFIYRALPLKAAVHQTMRCKDPASATAVRTRGIFTCACEALPEGAALPEGFSQILQINY